MFIIPYRLEISYTKIPVTNAIIIIVTSLAFIFTRMDLIPPEVVDSMVLRDWEPAGLFGCLFLHGGIIHLVGNMVFLWVFGNAVCSTVGNTAFLFLYLFLGLSASAAHLIFSGHPAIGASGAINGVVGMTLVLFPKNKLNCAYLFWFFFIFLRAGTFTLKCFWMIGLWLFFDITGVLIGGDNVAYWAHLGGFATGMAIASLLLYVHAIEVFDPTLLDVATYRKSDRPTSDLEELNKRMLAKRKARSLSQTWVAGLDLGSPGSNIGKTGPAEMMEDEPVPVFRLLSIAEKENVLCLYFVNDGDSIADLSVEKQGSLEPEIQPQGVFPKGAPGWLKVGNAGREGRQDLRLTIHFRGGYGRMFSKELSYIVAEKKISLR